MVSVIIPVKNGARTIAKCLDSVLALDYSDYEVIVVDDGSTDETTAILTAYNKRVQVITNKQSYGPSESRNLAAKLAKGEYLAFTDSDCLVDKDWLKELVGGMKADDIVSVGGAQMTPDDDSDFGKKVSRFMQKIGFATDYIHKGKYKTVSVSHNPSCNAIYRKEVLLKEDGFRRGLWPGEDVELDYRLRKRGYRLVFNPKAVIFHYRIPTPKSYINMMYRYGYVQAFMVRAYGIFRTIQLFPFILLGLICIMVLSIFFKPMIAYYLIAIFSLSLPFVLSHLYSRTLSLLVITLFYWNIGFLCGFFSPKNPITNNT